MIGVGGSPIAAKISEATGRMSHLCRRIIACRGPHFTTWTFLHFSSFRRFFRFVVHRILVCGNPAHLHRHHSRNDSTHYRRLTRRRGRRNAAEVDEQEEAAAAVELVHRVDSDWTGFDSDSDLVSLKISLLGDCQIGKTTFAVKYIGDEQEMKSLRMNGLNLMDKTLLVKGAKIGFNFWDVGGSPSSFYHLPIACKDAVAILFMFDLTSRCTLHSVTGWYTKARKWNQTAIPILIGTKFDDFVRLPPDLQWTIVTQARAYARAMKATLFFSSATHNINVNKIFKFITAKLFNLPWTVDRNLTLGEPTIDY